jgi:uncharacterized membrane protein (UPF0127 family)
VTEPDGGSRRSFLLRGAGGAAGLLFVPWWIRSGGRSGWGPAGLGRRPLEGFATTAISVRSSTGAVREACVLLADTPERREQGLMGVQKEQLRGYAGMLFAFPTPGTKSFWMRNTPLPLSIAFFDGDGRFVSSADMEPCGDSPDCPTTTSAGPAVYALEMLQGMLPSLGIESGAVLTIGGRCADMERA